MPLKNPTANRKYWREYRRAHPEENRRYYQNYVGSLKVETLSHYGPEGKLQCSWSDCEITDPDMLSLDHVNNDGKADREKRKRHSATGTKLYANLRQAKYPEGYQTLCMNHQLKKEILRRRSHEDTNKK